jgi:hypothetical protein
MVESSVALQTSQNRMVLAAFGREKLGNVTVAAEFFSGNYKVSGLTAVIKLNMDLPASVLLAGAIECIHSCHFLLFAGLGRLQHSAIGFKSLTVQSWSCRTFRTAIVASVAQ